MAFVFENLVIDRVVDGVFRNKYNEVLGGLNQVQGLSISTTSETKDKTDSTGVLIKRFFTSKSVEISAENAVVSMSLMGLQTGNGKQVATADNMIRLPHIRKVKKQTGEIDICLTDASNNHILPIDTGWTASGASADADLTLSVTGLTSDGIPDPSLVYTRATTAGPGTYAYSDGKITLPTDCTDYVQVVYEYYSKNGAKVLQSADKFPSECELILSVLVCDACDKEVLRHAYIVFPAFQMSPDFDITMDTDSAHPFSGTASVNYCSDDKAMFYIAISEDDKEAA